MPEACRAATIDAHAGSRHPVDVQAGVRELEQHADVGEGAGAAAGEHQSERPAGEPVGEPPEVEDRVARGQGELPGVGRGDPRRTLERCGSGPDEHDLGAAEWRGRDRLGRDGRIGLRHQDDGVRLPEAELPPRPLRLGRVAVGHEQHPVAGLFGPVKTVGVDDAGPDHAVVHGEAVAEHLGDRRGAAAGVQPDDGDDPGLWWTGLRRRGVGGAQSLRDLGQHLSGRGWRPPRASPRRPCEAPRGPSCPDGPGRRRTGAPR